MSKTALVYMPCGCVVDISSETFSRFKVFEVTHQEVGQFVTECPWCLATFGYEDLFVWFENNLRAPVQLPGPPKMMAFFDDLVEMVKRCDCGQPIVRRSGDQDLIHLDVSSYLLSPVRH